MKDKTCTIAGLRPHKLPRGPSEADNAPMLEALEQEIRKQIFRGYTVFQSGMAMGVDIWAAQMILRLKEEFPQIRLHCFLPCETQAVNWPEDWRELYYNEVLPNCDEVDEVLRHYFPGCMQQRNRKMIDRCSLLIAVHDGASNGGTAYTIDYAKKTRRRGHFGRCLKGSVFAIITGKNNL